MGDRWKETRKKRPDGARCWGREKESVDGHSCWQILSRDAKANNANKSGM